MPQDRRLDEEILASFEQGEWARVPRSRAGFERYSAYAAAALLKDRRVNIRISSRDLEDLQARAAAEGLPYQTLMSSVLHKYVTGRLVEAPAAQSARGRREVTEPVREAPDAGGVVRAASRRRRTQ